MGYDRLFRLLENGDGRVFFKTCICFIDGSECRTFEGVMRGKISGTVHEGWKEEIPYDRIFIPDGFRRHMGILSDREKNSISHRAEAARGFAVWYRKNAQ